MPQVREKMTLLVASAHVNRHQKPSCDRLLTGALSKVLETGVPEEGVSRGCNEVWPNTGKVVGSVTELAGVGSDKGAWSLFSHATL